MWYFLQKTQKQQKAERNCLPPSHSFPRSCGLAHASSTFPDIIKGCRASARCSASTAASVQTTQRRSLSKGLEAVQGKAVVVHECPYTTPLFATSHLRHVVQHLPSLLYSERKMGLISFGRPLNINGHALLCKASRAIWPVGT